MQVWYLYRFVFPSGSVYVGKTDNPKTRLSKHLSDAKQGSPWPVHRALRKHLGHTFEVVYCTANEAHALDTERALIEEARQEGVCLNVSDGGDGHSRRFCVRGHDCHTVGRRAHNKECKECHREDKRAKRQTPEGKEAHRKQERERYKRKKALDLARQPT